MLGVTPCPDAGCQECGAAAGHYFTCSQNPSFEGRARLNEETEQLTFSPVKVSKEDLECASRIEQAEKRLSKYVH